MKNERAEYWSRISQIASPKVVSRRRCAFAFSPRSSLSLPLPLAQPTQAFAPGHQIRILASYMPKEEPTPDAPLVDAPAPPTRLLREVATYRIELLAAALLRLSRARWRSPCRAQAVLPPALNFLFRSSMTPSSVQRRAECRKRIPPSAVLVYLSLPRISGRVSDRPYAASRT